MSVPIIYNVRSLLVRKLTTAMTLVGVALTVTTAVFIMALLAGLSHVFLTTGDPLNVLVLRKGSQAELSAAGVPREDMQALRSLSGLARDIRGEPLVSGEDVFVVVLPRRGGKDMNVTVRSLAPIGLEIRPKIKLIAGRWFTPGQREVAVSASIRKRFDHADLGDTIYFGKGAWTIVGIFDAGGTAHDSEVWADINQFSSDFNRAAFSSVLLRAVDPVAAESLRKKVSDDQRLKLEGTLETAYYNRQTDAGKPIKYVGIMVAIIMAIGSCFAAMNTMYAFVGYRAAEIATLRVLGYSRKSILMSFVLETLILSVCGAALGILIVLPLNGRAAGIQNLTTISESVFAIRVTPAVVGTALLFSIVIGLAGGLGPAWQASRQKIATALHK
jgi:putative ABC transport system permease protein